MHYIFIADESAPRNDAIATSAIPDRNEIEIVAPRVWDATRGDPWWRQSSFDLHRGLDVNEDEIDTVPAELLDDLFKL